MAISKERLEELIQKGVKIYDSWHGNEFCVRDIEKIEDDVVTYSFLLGEYKTTLEDLHENYDDFKWYKEFGCIEWVERLKLPTWEEFNKSSTFIFTSKDGTELDMGIWTGNNSVGATIKIYNLNGYNILYFEAPLTKENYYKACRKAKELFLNGDK